MIEQIILSLCLFISAIIFHELGHLFYFRSRGIKAKIYYKKLGFEIGTNKQYETLTDKEYKHLLLSGILLGILPILIATQYFTYGLLLLIPYFMIGSIEDIKNFIEVSKKEVTKNVD
jgi:hypothetical protein